MNSLENCLDENDVIGSIRSEMRSPVSTDKVWIIVEGIDDIKLFRKLITDKSITKVGIEQSNGGKSKLSSIVETLSIETNRVIGIRDADFIHISPSENALHQSIFITDLHDSEMMLIACNNSYRHVASEYLHNETDLIEIRNIILSKIAFLGGAKLINVENCIGLVFEGLGLGRFFNAQSKSIDYDAYLSTLLLKSPQKSREINNSEVIERIADITDLYNLCNGHDFQKIFALYINSTNKPGIKENEIGNAFRIAYRFEDFQETMLYKNLKEWSNQNNFKLFCS